MIPLLWAVGVRMHMVYSDESSADDFVTVVADVIGLVHSTYKECHLKGMQIML